MKFSNTLKLNAVDEWRPYYINYAGLKRFVYKGVGLQEAAAIRLQNRTEFLDACSKELLRVEEFFQTSYADLLSKCSKLEAEIAAVEDRALRAGVAGAPQGGPREERVAVWSSSNPSVARQRSHLIKLLQELYVKLNDLLDFASLNTEGFRKICKKFDKEHKDTTGQEMSERMMASCMAKEKVPLNDAIKVAIDEYACVACEGDSNRAKDYLRQLQHDHYEYERRTVFQDMLALEQQQEAAHLKVKRSKAEIIAKRASKGIKCVLFTAAFLGILLIPVTVFNDVPEQRNCAAILTFAGLMWATEAIPLHATAVTVPFLVVVLRVLRDTSGKHPVRLSAQDAANKIFEAMFSQVIFLLLGSFILASALSKHHIAKRLSTAVLSQVGTHPSVILLAIMMAALITSTFMSNVTAPTLCYGILHPILRYVKSDEPVGKALVMGVALASNLGGMMSPISSPQNAFAIETMGDDAPSWRQWFIVAVPVAVLGVLCCWLLLVLVYAPAAGGRRLKQLPQVHDAISYKQVIVSLVTVITIVLWCLSHRLEPVLGNMGIIAIIPMAIFIGFGMLNKNDLRAISWDIILLAQGGLALGEAVKSSGLLSSIAQSISELVGGFSEWQVLAVFCALMLVFTSFISHTVGAMVVLPVLQSIGTESGHAKLLVMGAALMCSGAMGLPISGFPNMTAKSLSDERGLPYVLPLDFYMVGVPGSVAAFLLIISLGYWLMQMLGF